MTSDEKPYIHENDGLWNPWSTREINEFPVMEDRADHRLQQIKKVFVVRVKEENVLLDLLLHEKWRAVRKLIYKLPLA